MKKKRLDVTIKWSNTIMINFYEVKKEDIKEHNPNWPEISDHLYIVLIIGDSGSGQTFF